MYYLQVLFRKLGKKHAELASKWIPSGGAYAAAGFMAIIYFTDWRVVVDKIPIYNTKFKGEN